MPGGRVAVICEDKNKDKELFEALKGSVLRMVEASVHDYMTVIGLEVPDCVIISVRSEGSDFIASMMEDIHRVDDNLPVIIVSGRGELDEAVRLMRAGAYDYFKRPVDAEKLKHSVMNAVHLYNLTKRVYLLENQMGWRTRFDDIVGHSAKMQEIFQLIKTVARSNATVLIMGESGTGKELVAKAIHNHSPRAKHRFVDINCGAIPRELLENELFGHERGAYTGADRRYIGSCERADKGTLFLDEICEMDLALQVKILRLLQERTFTRVGGTEKIVCDIRFIAATNKDIHKEVAEGRFREDLYYRLNVVPITIPPLRERSEDIPLLAKYFMEKYSEKNEKIFTRISADAMECLINYSWPGNVRELENVIESIVVLNNDSEIKVKHLPPAILKSREGESARRATPLFLDGRKIVPLELVEKYAIEAALQKCAGNIAEAARCLKIGQATLYRKIRQYGLRSKMME